MALVFATFEKAVQDALTLASGLADGKVVWARQDGTRPASPYVTIDLTSFRVLGQDGTRHTYDGGAAAGAEITLKHGGMREFNLTVTVFGDTLGSSSAVALAESLRSSLSKIAVRELLDAQNVSFARLGDVLNLTQVIDTAFEGRAVFEIMGYTTQEITDTLGYIASAEITGTIATATVVETVDIGSPPPQGVWGSGNVWD